jgi:hypothetical protein
MSDKERDTQTVNEHEQGPVEQVLEGESPESFDPLQAEHANGEYAEHEAEPAGEMDITQLDLQTEPLPDVDQSKLADRMEYAPSMQPGKFYNFIFKLDEKPVEGVTIKGKMHANFRYECILLRDDGSTGKSIRFLQANTFRAGKMESSRAEELLFALGMLSRFQREKGEHAQREKSFMLELLQEASGAQKVIRGQINWRRYDKATKQTWSTNPAKPYTKKDKETGQDVKVVELPWPKKADGSFNNRPDEFEGNYGSETISRVAPTKETMEAIKAEESGGSAPAE